jgi:hypothetical protein
MDRDKFNEIALIVLAVALVVVIMIFVFGLRDGNQCLENPFVYGAEELSEEPQGDLLCSCGFFNPGYESFFFDKDGLFEGLDEYDEEV